MPDQYGNPLPGEFPMMPQQPGSSPMMSSSTSWAMPAANGASYMAPAPMTSTGASWMNGYGGGPTAGAGATGVMPTAAPAGQGFMAKAGSWLSNGQNLGTVVQGIGALTQAYLGYKQMKQAQEALNLQKEAFNANLNNSIQTYNTSLEDRIRGRTSAYEGKEGDVQSYLAKHSLRR